MKLMYLLATFAVVLVMMASCTRQSVTGYTLTAAIDVRGKKRCVSKFGRSENI